jgi:hypothetical protein
MLHEDVDFGPLSRESPVFVFGNPTGNVHPGSPMDSMISYSL